MEQIISPGVFARETDQSLVRQNPPEVGAAIIGPTVKGAPLVPTYVTSYSEYLSKFGDIFKSGSNYYEYFTSLAAKDYFNSGGRSLLVTRIVSGSNNLGTYSSAIVPKSGSLVNSAASASFELETIAWGTETNNSGSILINGALISGSAFNVRWEVSGVDYNRGTFTLNVRRGDDNNSQKNILETWSNLSLDPMLPNFISRVIGDQKPVYSIDTDGNGYVDYQGDYQNNSQYIRVKSINNLHIDSIDNNGFFKVSTYSSTLPNIGSGSIGGAFTGGTPATNLPQIMNENINSIATNAQGFTSNDYLPAISLLNSKEEYRFNLIIAPGVTLGAGPLSAVADDLIALCENRGDTMAIIDSQTFGGTLTGATNAAASSNSNYAAAYWPWVQVYSSNLGKSIWVPSSTVIAGVYAFNDQVSAEWFAPAGLNRGGIPSVIQAERKLNKSDRDILYSGNVNPLATFPGQGIVIYGQKTLQKRATSLDRVNVRRLLISLKTYIGQIAEQLVFEQNTNATRNRFLAQVNPYLDSVVQRQGLYAYEVIIDESVNTPDVIDRNQLVCQIRIQPTKTIEFIILDFTITPTGVEFE